MSEQSRLLEKARIDWVTELELLLASARSGKWDRLPESDRQIKRTMLDDTEELERAGTMLDAVLATSPDDFKMEQSAGFLSTLADERRLIRDTASMREGHKRYIFHTLAEQHRQLGLYKARNEE